MSCSLRKLVFITIGTDGICKTTACRDCPYYGWIVIHKSTSVGPTTLMLYDSYGPTYKRLFWRRDLERILTKGGDDMTRAAECADAEASKGGKTGEGKTEQRD